MTSSGQRSEFKQQLQILRVYDVVRSAHMERSWDLPGVTILYRSCRYDFDARLAERANAKRAGVFRTIWHVLRHDVDVIEINEPLIARAAPRSIAAITGSRFRAALRRRRPARVVSYAIASMSPHAVAEALPLRSRLKWRALATLIPLVWRRVDRIAFGTALAEGVYNRWFDTSARWPTQRLIPALPTAFEHNGPLGPRAHDLVFLGDLSSRKGFPQLLAAWPTVRHQVPDARWTILGKGVGQADARALSDADASVSFLEDPPREEIFRILKKAKVLALPSQPTSRWREQVGLPIVEGLASGCIIVTTGQTGLADWLSSHEHVVIDDANNVSAIANGVVRALQAQRGAGDVVADLPNLDGREAANDWLTATDEVTR